MAGVFMSSWVLPLMGFMLGVFLGLLIRLRQWRAARQTLSPETVWHRDFYAHCRRRPVSHVEVAPGPRVISDAG